jgi:hypothetical protein
MIAAQLALLTAALFAGAAFYINFAEQPARLALDDRALLAEWKIAYPRGYLLQAPLAMLGGVLGILAWYQLARFGFLIGATLMLANWPWTMLVIARVNKKLMATAPEDAGAQSRALIVKWGGLHAVRTGLGCAAALAFLIGFIAK